MRAGRGAWLATAACCCVLVAGTATATAAEIDVNTTVDALEQDGHCSLREAITSANTDQASGATLGECPAGQGADTIVLTPGVYTLTRTGSHEDENLKGDLDVHSDLTIQGAGASSTAIDGNASVVGASMSDRVFDIFKAAAEPAPHVILSGVTVRNGEGPSVSGADPDGGGILIDAASTVTLSSDIVAANHAGSGLPLTRGGNGGGIYSEGVLTLVSTTVSANTSGNNFSGPTFPDGTGGGIDNAASGRLTIRSSTIFDNHTKFMGGNGALPGGSGGGVENSGSLLEIDASSLSANGTSAGGESGMFGAAGGAGGAIASTGGTLVVSNSTLSANFTGAGGGGAQGGGNGGAGAGLAVLGGSAVLVNDTLTANAAGTGGLGGGTLATRSGSGGSGGGVFASAGTAKLTNVTIAENFAGLPGKAGAQPASEGSPGAGGGIDAAGSAAVSTSNAIVASNHVGADCSGVLTDQGHNIGFGSGCPGSFAAGDPRLGPLQDNGGATLTMALGAGSAALDQVPLSGTGCPATDQRGVARPQGSACDVGAYELAVAAPVTPSTSATSAPAAPKTLALAKPLAPGLGRLTISPATFTAASTGASIVKGAKSARGATVTYTDSQAATTTFTVVRVRHGVRVHGRCVVTRAPSHGAKKCTRTVTLGSFTHSDHAGHNSLRFSGRVAGQTLRAGTYRLEATPRTGRLSGTPQRAQFTVVR
jgi:CSLREA domain-containing protein